MQKKFASNSNGCKKVENVLRNMQDIRKGISFKSSSLRFRQKEYSVFSGLKYLKWIENYFQLTDELDIQHLASLFILLGYIVPVDFDENSFHIVRRDNYCFYRFQTPFFWPTNYTNPSCLDYVVYLCKRTMQNKIRLKLSNSEAENLAFLQNFYQNQWEFIYMQAQAQLKINKKRDRFDRKVLEDQERSFWFIQANDLIYQQVSNDSVMYLYKSKAKSDSYKKQIFLLKIKLERKLYVVTKTTESHFKYHEYLESYDHFCQKKISNWENIMNTNINVNSNLSLSRSPSPNINSTLNSSQNQNYNVNSNSNLNQNTNPWLIQALDYSDIWEQYENSFNELTAERVKKWSLSLRVLLKDPLGYENFLKFLDKEYSSENLRFLNAIKNLKEISQREIGEKSWEIWNEFLSNEANYPINIDSKSYELTKNCLKNPTRWCFDIAANHVYALMKNDSYYRFLRSNSYNNLINFQNNNITFSSDNISKLSY